MKLSITIDEIEYRFFNHLYAVSRCGKVLRKLQLFEPVINVHGYSTVGGCRVHRMVAECWMESFNPKHHIHHINHNRTDNRTENLACISAAEHHAIHPMTDEGKMSLKNFRKGRVTSEETKAKQRAALIGKTRPHFDRAGHSAESRAARGVSHVRNQSCKVMGIVYRSFTVASIATGIHRFTLRKRCLSKNFPDYEIV